MKIEIGKYYIKNGKLMYIYGVDVLSSGEHCMLPEGVEDDDIKFMKGVDVDAFLDINLKVQLLCYRNYFDEIMVLKENNETFNHPFSCGWMNIEPSKEIIERFEKVYSVLEEIAEFSSHMVSFYKDKYNGEDFSARDILEK